MNPHSPREAQIIVQDYLSLVESHAATDVYPCTRGELPHPKDTIRAAFETCVTALAASGQLTSELRDYLEVAYVSLADYVDEECYALLREYAHAGAELAAGSPLAKDKVASDAWRRVSEQSRLAGRLARAIAEEADSLRAEFRAWQADAIAPHGR